MKRLIAALLLASALIPTSSRAATIYLSCTFPDASPVDITLDEANSRATVYVPASGKTFAFDASFGANEVRFENASVSYIVSRIDLSVRRLIKILHSENAGRCQINAPEKRAF